MADFQAHLQEFSDRGTSLLAASVDDRADAIQTVRRQNLTYPVGCEVNARVISAQTGALFSGDKEFLHATGFLLNREGKVMVAVYSTGAIGRLTPKDCLGLIDHLQKQD